MHEAVNDKQRIVTLINALSNTLKNTYAEFEFEFELARDKSTPRLDVRPVAICSVGSHMFDRSVS